MIKPIINVKTLGKISSPFGSESYLENIKIESEDFSEGEIDDLSLDKVLLENVVMNQVKIRDLKITDSILLKCSLAGGEFEFVHFSRTEFRSSRLQGVQWAQSRIIDTTCIASKLNEANLRFSKLKNVLFDSCDMMGVDFAGAELKNVTFHQCNLTGAQFSQAKLEQVALSGSDIKDISISSESIKEVFVDTGQAIYLSAIFGLKIRD